MQKHKTLIAGLLEETLWQKRGNFANIGTIRQFDRQYIFCKAICIFNYVKLIF